MDKKLKPDVFWAINSNKYDTYMVSSTDRISFKCEDLYRFMEDYAQLRLSAVSGSLPTDEEISKQAKKYDVEDMNDAINRIGGFIVGAKWMRDFISGNDR